MNNLVIDLTHGGVKIAISLAKKGNNERCGSILIGFENAAPRKVSCIGQLHNYKAVSHDMSPFYSGKTNRVRKSSIS